MKTLIAFLTLITILYLSINESGSQMYTSPHVSQFMNEVSDNLPNEIFGCLEYQEFGGDIFVYDYYIPYIFYSNKQSVRAMRCNTDEISFHNHPDRYMESDSTLINYYEKYTNKKLKESNQMIYMSGNDIFAAILTCQPYVIVGANGEWAWWSQDQIKEAHRKGIKLLQPIGNQKTF